MFERLKWWLTRRSRESTMNDELEAHIACETEDQIARGLDPTAAREAALRAFGNRRQVMEDARQVWTWTLLEQFIQDCVYALRALRKNPALTLPVLLSLALGIGATAAVFSLVDSFLVRPISVPQTGRVVRIVAPTQSSPIGFLSYPEVDDIAKRTESFEGLVTFRNTGVRLDTGNGQARLALALSVNGAFFSTLHAEPSPGRGFLPSEDEVAGRDAVVVLSHGLWIREYGGRPDIVGKRLWLNAREFTIVGIAPKDFTGVETFVQPEIYVPRMMARALAGGATNSFLTDRSARITPALARLKPGVGIQQARDEMARIGSQLEQEHPETNRGYKLGVLSQLDYKITQSPDNVTMAAVFMGVAALVLGIACVNVINLVLSTMPARTGEMALKVALGASRSRLARQLLVESVLVSIGGSIGGLAIAMVCARLISSIRIASLLPLTLDTRVDYRVVMFGFATGIAAGILSGLIPAIRVWRGSVNLVLRTSDSRLGRSGRMWMRRGMVVAQMSLALVVLVMSGLFIQDMRLSRRMDPGFRVTKVVTAGFDPAGNGRDVAQTRGFYNELLEKVRAIPGVQAAGLSQHVPLGVSSSNADLLIDGYQPPDPRGGDASIQVSTATVSEGYLEALAIPIVRGRTFDVHDTNDSPKIAIINEAMAEKYWPTSDPIGSRIRLQGTDGGIAEIVGIARTSKYRELSEKPLPFLYLPQRQGSRSFMILFVATEGDPIESLPAIRRAAAEIDADVPLYDVRTMSDHFQQQALWGARLVANVMTAVAVVGLFLGALGLYGILAYSVSERAHEIGIRMAIGASKRDVLRMVLSQGIWLTAIGTAIGLTLMLALNGVTKQLVTAMNPLDPSLYAIVIGVLIAVTLFACYIPARRAATVDPNRALRSE